MSTLLMLLLGGCNVDTAAAARRLSAACELKETAVAVAESAPKEAAEEAAPAAAMVETEET